MHAAVAQCQGARLLLGTAFSGQPSGWLLLNAVQHVHRLATQIAAAKLARKYPGVRLHTHLAENQEDIDFSLKTYGCRPGEYLK